MKSSNFNEFKLIFFRFTQEDWRVETPEEAPGGNLFYLIPSGNAG